MVVKAQISAETARKIGLLNPCPVAAGAGDNASAAVGCGVVEDGDAFKIVYSSVDDFNYSE